MGCAASKKAVEPGGVWPQEPKSPAIKSASAGYASPKTAEGDEPLPERPRAAIRRCDSACGGWASTRSRSIRS